MNFWTEERLNRLIQLTSLRRYTTREIAAKLGTTRNAVIGKCDREGIELLDQSSALSIANQKVWDNATPEWRKWWNERLLAGIGAKRAAWENAQS
jgi:hypothetical protein